MLAPSPTVQVLQAARNLIADESRWGRRWLSTTADGTCAYGVMSEDAVAWCAHGAIMHEGGEGYFPAARLLDRVASELFPDTIAAHPEVIPAAAVNDHLGHAAVMQMFDRAIELAVA